MALLHGVKDQELLDLLQKYMNESILRACIKKILSGDAL
jgi:hypothetical protein